jgi:DNA-binding transcriptional MerR regulator
MQIKTLARCIGVDAETIRYYEKQGLLPAPARRDNGYRDYDDTHVERLAFIRHCRALDLSLADVRQLLLVLDQSEASKINDYDNVEHLLDAHLARVHARLLSLQALEQQLMVLRSRCHGGHSGADGQRHCGILTQLVTSAATSPPSPKSA